jgi:hypothetical protein
VCQRLNRCKFTVTIAARLQYFLHKDTILYPHALAHRNLSTKGTHDLHSLQRGAQGKITNHCLNFKHSP